MSEVEHLAQEQFNTFKNRLYEMLSEIEEEYKSTFIHGYAKGETDRMFRAKDYYETQLVKAKELLSFWVNAFYEISNDSSKYEARHKALIETEQFLKEE